ncbi:MAG TPA: ComEC/Rec2 family competence protein [Phenylobacterium sp.]|nr:ComEC/Rec2 family competence protein [Phenylobacterium sp.]
MTTGRWDIEEAGSGVTGAPHNTRLSRIARSWGLWLAAQVALQADRTPLWTPAAYGAGAAAYLALRFEPPLWPLALAALAAILGAGAATLKSRNRAVTAGAILLAFLAAGAFVAKSRTLQAAAPLAPADETARLVSGYVLDIESPGAAGPRILIAPVAIGGLPPDETPKRARLSLRGAPPTPGSAIVVRARLNPPPGPASPGAYDFARDAYFHGVGGVGFAVGRPREAHLPDAPWRLAATMRLNAMRWSLAQKIHEQAEPRAGGLAAAMVTGHEAFVPPEQVEAMRASGLAHLISISGLHMAIVGGFVFAAVRLAVAAWPWAALRVSGKKVAAGAAIAATLAYLALSGGDAPAVRAAVTAIVAFAAVLADRRALSLRNLALAALVVITLQPEAVAQPGFQMSFAATAALVALAEAWPRPAREISVPWPIRFVQAAGVWLLLSIGVSLVAGLATGPFAIQHFNRVSTWGLPANLVAAPISSFVMMPALAIGAVLAPFGLGEAPLAVAGVGIEGILRVAELAARSPPPTLTVASAPGLALPVAFFGILILCAWRGPLRWLGLPLALAVNLWPRPAPPDLWIADGGDAVAVREGRAAAPLRPDAKAFALEFWSRRRALVLPSPEETGRRDRLFACDRWSCAPQGASPPWAVAANWSKRPPDPARLAELCRADLVILRSTLTGPCAAPAVLDARDFARGGSAELWRTPEGWKVRWANDLRGRRPWTINVGAIR